MGQGIFLGGGRSSSTPKIVQSQTEPTDLSALWMDTLNGGTLKYFNGDTWVPVKVVWG